ncbi:arginase [Rhizobiales bacterium]|uniref:arginase n=1 Tax=Hongsoonwoonella zoysiae TaxID=2821844 RepID=UPI001560A01E|nr:arginase [Hongsoonwoonella zoysiae]NRG19099.1 arginase [Hongsoonwoonella zoysiae]
MAKRTDTMIGIIGVPLEAGTGRRGAAMGPAALRVAELPERLQALGLTVQDFGDITPDDARALEELQFEGKAHLPATVAAWVRPLARKTREIIGSGHMPIVLGGDHSLSMGSVMGVARHWQEQDRPLFVLWLDAHADFNTPSISPSGNMHGMSLALLAGEEELKPVFDGEPTAFVDPSRMCVFGARSIDPEERELLKRRGVNVVDMRMIDEHGVSVLMRSFLEHVAERNGVLHVSLDVDFLDPTVAPGVGTTVPGGATYREAHLVMEMLEDSDRVVSVDVVELNPFLDERGRSATVLAELVASLFGQDVMDRPTQAFA